MALDHHVGARLHALRSDRGLGADDLAALLGVSGTDYFEFERGHRQLPAHHLFKLCLTFDVAVTSFFEGYEVSGNDIPSQS